MKVKMYKELSRSGDLLLRIPLSGGKAGKGNAKTSNVQVFNTADNVLEKQFRFNVGDAKSKDYAISSAHQYCKMKNFRL